MRQINCRCIEPAQGRQKSSRWFPRGPGRPSGLVPRTPVSGLADRSRPEVVRRGSKWSGSSPA